MTLKITIKSDYRVMCHGYDDGDDGDDEVDNDDDNVDDDDDDSDGDDDNIRPSWATVANSMMTG